MADDQGASYASKSEAVTDETSLVKVWVDALAKADKEEKDWRDAAEQALEVYSGKKNTGGRQFNILHSNVETVCPAIYNSTPVPDVRRRYSDEDKVAKVAGDMIERGLTFSIDNYDFDSVMKLVVRDGEIVGRGVPRVRYEPTFGGPITGPDGEPVLGDDGNPVPELVYQEVNCDYVPWRYFRRGPGRTWKDIPWVAYGDFLSKDEVRKLAPDCAEHLTYSYMPDKDGKDKKVGSEEGQIYQRALVWQIWDKDSKRVISICTDYPDKPLMIAEDPLSVQGFFPTPRPYQPITSPDGLIPIIPYSIYEDLVLELNEITRRISSLVKQLRPRGIYGGPEAVDVIAWANAADGELVPSTNIQAMTEGGGMERAIAWFPLEPVVIALRQLVDQREQVKQTIYEVTGMSDIIRGASKASETATAQNIKQQWGSLRIQERQMEVARLARDLFRMKAEIIAGKFQWATLVAMTSITVPTAVEKQQAQQMVQQFMQAAQQAQQAQQPPPPMPPNGDKIKDAAEGPTAEEVQALLANDITRTYRIDIETDSTVRADLTRNQQTMNLFLQGTAQFTQSMGPIIQEIPEMKKVALTIYGAFSRHFKLGKQAEDALDNALDDVMKETPQQKPDPNAAKAQADQQMMQMKMQIDQGKAQVDQQLAQMKMQMEQIKAQGSAQIANIKAQAESNRAQVDMQMSQQEIEQSKIDAQASQRKAENDAVLAEQKIQHAQAKMDTDMERQRVKIMTDQFKDSFSNKR